MIISNPELIIIVINNIINNQEYLLWGVAGGVIADPDFDPNCGEWNSKPLNSLEKIDSLKKFEVYIFAARSGKGRFLMKSMDFV